MKKVRVRDWKLLIASLAVPVIVGVLFFQSGEPMDENTEASVVLLICLLAIPFLRYIKGVIIDPKKGKLSYPFLILFRRSVKIEEIKGYETSISLSSNEAGKVFVRYICHVTGDFGSRKIKFFSRNARAALTSHLDNLGG